MRRAWQPTPVFLPGEPHGQRSLAGYTHGITESDTKKQLSSSHSMTQLRVQRFPLLNASRAEGKRGGEEAGSSKEATKRRELSGWVVSVFWFHTVFI